MQPTYRGDRTPERTGSFSLPCATSGALRAVATSGRRHVWDDAEPYPSLTNGALRLTPEQNSMIGVVRRLVVRCREQPELETPSISQQEGAASSPGLPRVDRPAASCLPIPRRPPSDCPLTEFTRRSELHVLGWLASERRPLSGHSQEAHAHHSRRRPADPG